MNICSNIFTKTFALNTHTGNNRLNGTIPTQLGLLEALTDFNLGTTVVAIYMHNFFQFMLIFIVPIFNFSS